MLAVNPNLKILFRQKSFNITGNQMSSCSLVVAIVEVLVVEDLLHGTQLPPEDKCAFVIVCNPWLSPALTPDLHKCAGH